MKIRFVLAATLFAPVMASSSAADDASGLLGKWRITRAVVAPWTDEAGAGEKPALVGESVVFRSKSVKASAPLACGDAEYEATSMPPEGLFQGGLPTPANEAMTPLGFSDQMIEGVLLACDTGTFEFHFVAPDTALFALDNRIWTLDRSPGARASKSSAESAVQRFLEAHFDGDMGFSPAAFAQKRAAFAPSLVKTIDAYLAKPQDPNEAPTINGDPFTDSQDYPARFAVQRDDKMTKGTAVPVEFADAFRKRKVIFEMVREGGRWLIADLKFEDGATLSAILVE